VVAEAVYVGTQAFVHDLKHNGDEDGGCCVNLSMYIYEVDR